MRSTLKDFFPIFLEGRAEGGKKEQRRATCFEDSEIKCPTESLHRDLTGFENYPFSFHSNKVFSGLLGIGGYECESKHQQKMSVSQTHERFNI